MVWRKKGKWFKRASVSIHIRQKQAFPNIQKPVTPPMNYIYLSIYAGYAVAEKL